jgi:hypothetical protein
MIVNNICPCSSQQAFQPSAAFLIEPKRMPAPNDNRRINPQASLELCKRGGNTRNVVAMNNLQPVQPPILHDLS